MVELGRSVAGAVRPGGGTPREIIDSCRRCRDSRVPDVFTSIGLHAWHAVSGAGDAAAGALPADLRAILDGRGAVKERNLEALAAVARSLEAGGLGAGPDGPPVLLGDAAILLGLYDSLAVFPASLWVVAVPGAGARGTGPALEEALTAPPFDLRVCGLGSLAGLIGGHSRLVEAGPTRWRVPSGELLVALMAGRVGDPEAVPTPPSWFHLAVAILGWGDRLDLDAVLTLAAELRIAPQVHRGLAAAAVLFPELAPVVPAPALEIPVWERWVALRIAASRLVKYSLGTMGEDD